MQLPQDEEVVLISGLAPIKAKKLRYYRDNNFTGRVSPPPALADPNHPNTGCPPQQPDDWGSDTRVVSEGLSQPWFDQVGGADDGGKDLAPPLDTEKEAPAKDKSEDKTPTVDSDDTAIQSKRAQDLQRAPETARRAYGVENGAPKRSLLDF